MSTETIFSKLNAGSVALKALYGSDTNELQKQATRYTNILRRYLTEFGEAPVEFFSSPGRTEIGGNHTDHNYGRVLAGAVNLDNVAVAAKNNSNVVRIESAGYPKFEVDLSS